MDPEFVSEDLLSTPVGFVPFFVVGELVAPRRGVTCPRCWDFACAQSPRDAKSYREPLTVDKNKLTKKSPGARSYYLRS